MDMLRKKELVQSLINITDLNGSGTRVNVTSFLMGGVSLGSDQAKGGKCWSWMRNK